MRPVVRWLGLLTLATLATGCMKVDLSLQLHSDDTVDGTMTYAVSRDLLTLTNSSPEDLLGQVASQGPLPSGVSAQESDYADDTFVGKTLTFSDVDIGAFQRSGIGGETLSIQRVGDTFQVSGEVDLTSSATGQLQPGTAQLAKDMQLRLAITFPGPVQQQTGGTITGNTVTWTPVYGQKTEIRATGSAVGDESGSPIVWIAIAAGVVLLIAILLLVLRRRRARSVPVEPPAPASAPDAAS
jgi:MYXO-CTERM domain-containing protein